jgi:hypothetical protein
VTKIIRNQDYYTQSILREAGQNQSIYSEVQHKLWWNHTDSNNLRLSKQGIQFIKKFTQIPIYECNLAEPLRNRTLIQLSRLFTCPYYINKLDHLLLLGEEQTVMLKLHADNLQQYLDNLQL